jgi:hypothetical protein
MDAEERDEPEGAAAKVAALLGVTLDIFDEFVTSEELSDVPWGLASSFFHIKHLDIEN